MRIDILSLFPGYFSGPFDESIIKRARQRGLIDIRLIDIREFADPPGRRVDDRPYGGGPGMVMMPGPVTAAIRHVKTENARVIHLSPQGRVLTAAKCRELSIESHLVLLCGHYEGIDQRVLDAEVHEEISIGSYVLSNGCLPAIVVVDAVTRLLPEALGDEQSAAEDSFEQGILDHPHYTRPPLFEGMHVPDVLLRGDHQKIAHWRRQAALDKTRRSRPDLLGEKSPQ